VIPAVELELGALSHQGLVRSNNEDCFLVARLDRGMKILLTNVPPGSVPERHAVTGHFLLVADGMGGAAAGEVDQANVGAGRKRCSEGQLVGGQSRVDTSLPAAGFGLRRLSSFAGVFRHARMKARAVPRLIVARQRRRAIFGDSDEIRTPSRPIRP